ncbi:hypothetical protein ACVWWK_001558 [Bradyrhizobium sp. LB9.1b]
MDNSISLEQVSNRACAKLSPADNDSRLWSTMHEVAIGLAKHLADDPKIVNLEYWWWSYSMFSPGKGPTG